MKNFLKKHLNIIAGIISFTVMYGIIYTVISHYGSSIKKETFVKMSLITKSTIEEAYRTGQYQALTGDIRIKIEKDTILSWEQPFVNKYTQHPALFEYPSPKEIIIGKFIKSPWNSCGYDVNCTPEIFKKENLEKRWDNR